MARKRVRTTRVSVRPATKADKTGRSAGTKPKQSTGEKYPVVSRVNTGTYEGAVKKIKRKKK